MNPKLIVLFLAACSSVPSLLSAQDVKSTVAPIEIEILLVELDEELESQELLKFYGEPNEVVPAIVRLKETSKVFDEFRLQTITDQKAEIQVSAEQPVLSGIQQTGRGGSGQKIYRTRNSGVVISAIATVVDEKVVLNYTFEKSAINLVEKESDNDGASNELPGTDIITAAGTLQVKNNSTVIANSIVQRSNGKTSHYLLFVTASIIEGS